MLETNDRIAQLILKYLNEEMKEEERAELDAWIAASTDNHHFFERYTHTYLQEKLDYFASIDETSGWQKLRSLQPALHKVPARFSVPGQPQVHRIHFLKTTWFRYAAVLLLIAGTALYLYRTTTPQKEIVGTDTIHATPTDILPGGNKAILTLADGSTIVLDSAATGTLAQQGDTKIIQLNAGALAYHAGTNTSNDLLYNTIRTPNGGQYQITLPDGTRVWLNAASSIRFPIVFAKDRTVEVTGESYLEVAADKSKPFFVKTGETTIQVLGTSFNINAYTDEPVVKATLLEGSVKLTHKNTTRMLEPGQQAVIREDMEVRNKVDLEQVMAWKNGWFSFTNADIATVMRQLARWYNVDVKYEGVMPLLRFDGEIDRNLRFRDVLEGITKSTIHYRVEGDHTIVILP